MLPVTVGDKVQQQIAPEDITNIECSYTEVNVNNYEKIIDFNVLKKYFSADEEKGLNAYLNSLFKEILSTLTEVDYYISPRSWRAVTNYCSVAQRYFGFEKDNVLALDYAISQKILPQISGFGERYSQMLNKLGNICSGNNLLKCSKIVNRIKSTGDTEHGYYQFFTR